MTNYSKKSFKNTQKRWVFVLFSHPLDSCKILKWKAPKNHKFQNTTSAENNLAISKEFYMKDLRKVGSTTHKQPFLKHQVC